MSVLIRPVLISADEISEVPIAQGYKVETLEAAIETKTVDETYRDGVFEAAELMLRESAVVVQYNDINDPGKSIWEDDPQRFKRSKLLLGFNDHGGGSESGFKLLLNSFFDGEEPTQHMLFSPPEEDGSTSNLTFRQADFTMPCMEVGRKYTTIPNPLKTSGAALYRGRKFYDFWLIGDDTTPQRFSEAFKDAGFNFEPTPFELDKDSYRHLRRLEDKATANFVGPRVMNWPGDQFAIQIEQLRAAEALAA